jgi:hypothetical protein
MSLVESREYSDLLVPESVRAIEDVAAKAQELGERIAVVELLKDLVDDGRDAGVQRQILDVVTDESLPPTLRRRLDHLLLLAARLKIMRDHLRSAKLPIEADSMLRLIHDRLAAELLYSHERTQTLVRMSHARRLPAETSRKERKNAVDDWRSEKARMLQDMAVLNRPIRRRIYAKGLSEAETHALVKTVLDEVTAKTMATFYRR